MRKTLIAALMIGSFLAGAVQAAEKAGPKYKFSFAERFRFVSWDNAINLDESQADTFSFTRHRTNLTFQWFPGTGMELAVKLTNEFRAYLAPKNRDFDLNEVFFDNLYFKWKGVGGSPLTLTLGRQNIMLGEGFVIMDGHPLDGSRSIYFNAVRADYRFDPNTTLNAFVSYVPDQDNILPILNDQDQALIEQPETGLALYLTRKFSSLTTEAYLIRKNIGGTDARPIESGINAFGGRVTIPLQNRLSLCGEVAYQFGSYGDFDRSAFGGYTHLDYTTPETVPLVRMLSLGGIYLSGDNPDTPDIEGWDPLFSRWPKWSESYIYTLIRENGVAYWSNINSIYAEANLAFCPEASLKLTDHILGAQREAAAGFPGGDNLSRGNLLIGRLNLKLNAHLSGHFVWEHFTPGGFYFENADSFNWLRFELMLKY